jgi:hypothetical protein
MSSSQTTLTACPSREQWLNWALDGGAELNQSEQLAHLDACTACAAQLSDVRRFQGLLQRGKAPALTLEQRQSLDERIRLQAGLWEGPRRMKPWLIWGTALAAATALALVVVRPFSEKQHTSDTAVAAIAALHWQASIEGEVEVARADGLWQRAGGSLELNSGTRVRSTTGARLTVANRFEVEVVAGSEFDVVGLGVNHADLRVRHGEVEWQVSKLHPGQRFAVMFGGFRASVVGTRFWVRQSSDGSDGQVQVSEGAVRVDAADDPTAPLAETTTVVRAGQRWRHTGGIMSLEPTQAVAAPHAVTPQSDEAGAVTGSPAVAAPAAMATRGTAHGKPRAAGSAADPDADRHILIEVPPQTMPPPEQPGEAGGR